MDPQLKTSTEFLHVLLQIASRSAAIHRNLCTQQILKKENVISSLWTIFSVLDIHSYFTDRVQSCELAQDFYRKDKNFE